jgi:hypothetical protein
MPSSDERKPSMTLLIGFTARRVIGRDSSGTATGADSVSKSIWASLGLFRCQIR